MLKLTPGTGITATVDIGEDTEVTTDLMATMDTTADLIDMVTTERDLLMMLPPPNLAPTPILQLTRGTVTTGMTVMVTTALAIEAITGDKKWTSRTTSDLSL